MMTDAPTNSDVPVEPSTPDNNPVPPPSSILFKDGQPVYELPTDGVYEIKQLNGRLVIPFKEGKKNGEMVSYNVDDQIISKATYQNDSLCGPSTLYSSYGNIETTSSFKDNLLDGPFASYYPNGVKQCEGNYTKGKLEGPFTFYDEFGDPAKKTNYKDGLEHGKSIAYFSKSQGGGICQESHYEKGLLVQDQKLFYSTGELLQKIPYKQGKAQSYPEPLDKKGKPITDPANQNRGK